MFSDNLPFAEFIQTHLEMMKMISNVLIIILIIVALSNGGVSGASAYAALIIAVITGFAGLIVPVVYKL